MRSLLFEIAEISEWWSFRPWKTDNLFGIDRFQTRGDFRQRVANGVHSLNAKR